MQKVVRFGVSLEKDIFSRLEEFIKQQGFESRSGAIAHLIRHVINEQKVKEEDAFVCSTIFIVYDHHKRELVKQILDVQHDYHSIIISNVHIHLDHDNCLELIILKGQYAVVYELFREINGIRGLKLASLSPVIPITIE